LTKVKYGKESNENKILKIGLVFNFEFLSMHSENEYGIHNPLACTCLPRLQEIVVLLATA
jgi:hypothetical protein